jgi:plasmid stability protein
MTYLLRDIPDDLWRKVKAKAALKGESIRDVLLRVLTQYVKS